MNNAIYILICLSLGGCATIPTENEFYHRFAQKPSITEEDLGNGNRRETVSNPYEVPIIATIDCDNEQKHRELTIKANKSASFNTVSEIDHNCSVLHWKVK